MIRRSFLSSGKTAVSKMTRIETNNPVLKSQLNSGDNILSLLFISTVSLKFDERGVTTQVLLRFVITHWPPLLYRRGKKTLRNIRDLPFFIYFYYYCYYEHCTNFYI